MPLPKNPDWTLQNKTLKSGIEIQFPTHLDGGGIEMVDDLISAIKKTGKPFYNRACEWCAGFGVLGFEVLGLGLTKHIVFTDYYHVAIDTCLENARKNHLINYVSGHVSGTINGIPNIEKWDLVISNPPHVYDKEYFLEHIPGGREQHHNLDNTCRLTVDQNFGIHKEFFKNIKEKLTTDADVYLIEAVVPDCFIEWAEQGGLYLHSRHPVSFLPHGGILHFKVK
jgi:methylase of polypeptide subunit release factors